MALRWWSVSACVIVSTWTDCLLRPVVGFDFFHSLSNRILDLLHRLLHLSHAKAGQCQKQLFEGGINLVDLPHIAQKDDVDFDQAGHRFTDVLQRIFVEQQKEGAETPDRPPQHPRSVRTSETLVTEQRGG